MSETSQRRRCGFHMEYLCLHSQKSGSRYCRVRGRSSFRLASSTNCDEDEKRLKKVAHKKPGVVRNCCRKRKPYLKYVGQHVGKATGLDNHWNKCCCSRKNNPLQSLPLISNVCFPVIVVPQHLQFRIGRLPRSSGGRLPVPELGGPRRGGLDEETGFQISKS